MVNQHVVEEEAVLLPLVVRHWISGRCIVHDVSLESLSLFPRLARQGEVSSDACDSC
jgi:hypothetical protein